MLWRAPRKRAIQYIWPKWEVQTRLDPLSKSVRFQDLERLLSLRRLRRSKAADLMDSIVRVFAIGGYDASPYAETRVDRSTSGRCHRNGSKGWGHVPSLSRVSPTDSSAERKGISGCVPVWTQQRVSQRKASTHRPGHAIDSTVKITPTRGF